ncbi:MAG: phosphoglycerate kinase [bacterium]|nr:phosphoglycerate kinase [bacterium]
MKIRTLKDIAELKGKKVLLRVDFNVPLKENGEIQDDTRIKEALPTIKELQRKKAKIIIASHLGRPGGKIVEELRLSNVAQYLSKLLKKPVKKLDETIGPEVKKEIEKMKNGDIVMLENTRFHKEEKECEKKFTKKLASLADIFINDAFGTAHRKHASTAGVAAHLTAYAGLLMEKEITALSPIIEEEPIRPLTMIFGGAKIDTKIGIIKNFIDKADYFLLGGALANTFILAAGYNTGESKCEEDKVEVARNIMLDCEKHHEKFIIPHDVIVASEISDKAQTIDIPVEDVIGDMKILDIGKWTAEKYCNIIQKSGTVIWNGPLGLYEFEPFRKRSATVAKCLADHNCVSIIGGGDTADCLKRLKIPFKKFTHVSTGGGACIEFLSGQKLPGIEVLKM